MSKLDVLNSPSVGFITPPASQSVFPNYKLEIQDGQGTEVEVIKLESFRFSPQPTACFSPVPLLPPPIPVGFGWVAFDPTWSPLPGPTTPFSKWPELTAGDLNLHCKTSHLARRLGPKAPPSHSQPGGFLQLPACGWIRPQLAGNSEIVCSRPCLSGSPPCSARLEGLEVCEFVV